MKQVNMCGFPDILMFAERTVDGLFYNGAHDLFVRADVFSGEVYVEDMKHELENYREQLSEDQIKVYEIVVAFAKEHDVKEFCFEPKNW